jgi:hypothetical protein
MREIRRRRGLLPIALRRDPDFAITSPNWDTFARWEWCPDWGAGYLDDADWDRNWAPAASFDNNKEEDEDDDDDEEDDFHEHDGQGCVGVQDHPPPPRVSGEFFYHIYNGRVVRDNVDDMIKDHYFQAADRGETYVMPPELMEEEELAVAVLIGQEEEMRAFPSYEDALALLVAPPGPPPMQPRVPHRRGHAARPGWSPGMRGLELRLHGRRPRRRSWAGLPGRRLHRQDHHHRQWRTGRGLRGRSSTSPAMTMTR